MLDFLRRSATSVFAWLILGVLALVFGLSFGLPSDSLSFGPAPLVKVHGEKIGEDDFRHQFNLIASTVGIPNDAKFQELVGVKEEVIDTSVEREVLAHEAEELGLSATLRDAEDLTVDGHVIVLGDTFDWLGDLSFNYDIFTKNFLQRLQMPEPKYLDMQRREILARTMRDVVRSSVVVTEGELRRTYEAQANKLSLSYARYEPARFAELVDPTPKEIDAKIEAERDALTKQFEAQGTRFAKLPEQARLWVIEIPKPEGEEEAAGPALAEARSRASRVLERIRGGEDFRAVARETSAHGTARSGGDYGWVSEGSGSGLDPVVDETAKQLEVDEVSEVLEGESAFYVVRVSGRREGDVPLEDALRELAEEAVKRDRGRELAEEAARHDLAAIAAGTSMEQVFETPGALGTEGGIEELPLEGEEGEEDDEANANEEKIALRETGLFSKGEPVPGLGPQPELVEAAWSSDPETKIVDRVFEVGDSFVLAGLARKEEASDEGFAEQRDELYAQARIYKGNSVIARWTARQCLEAKATGDIVVSEDKIERVVTYDTKIGEDEEGNPLMKPYSVCDRVGQQGGLLRSGRLQQAMGGG